MDKNVNKNKNIIEINGRQYDASSGKPLHGQSEQRSIDGVNRRKTTVPKAAKRLAPQPLQHHSQQASKTLMRTVVKKPSHEKEQKARSELAVVKPAVAAIVPKLSLGTIDAKRQDRAEQTPKSSLVRRFSDPTAISSQPETLAASPVVPEVSEPLHVQASPTGSTQSLDLFSRALEQADAHQIQTARKTSRLHARPRHSSRTILAGSGAALLLVAAFLFQQNLPNLHLRAASTKAGFAASLPGYEPAGFRLGAISSQAGSVAVAYKSNSDQRAFTVTEKPSDWNDQTLLTSYVSNVAGNNYQTASANGNTVYIFGNNNATWLSNGVW